VEKISTSETCVNIQQTVQLLTQIKVIFVVATLRAADFTVVTILNAVALLYPNFSPAIFNNVLSRDFIDFDGFWINERIY
jgi:hypothetical protein